MAVLHVLHYPDERLRTIAKPVEKVDAEIQKLSMICLKRCI